MIVIVADALAKYSDGAPSPSYFDPGYQSFANLTGCGSALSTGTTLACLRSLPTSTVFSATLALLSKATLVLPFNRVMDGYFHDTLPSAQVRAKRVANIPLITGAFHQ